MRELAESLSPGTLLNFVHVLFVSEKNIFWGERANFIFSVCILG